MRIGFGLLVATCAIAQTPSPELRIEAIDAGSVFYVRNASKQPLTAFLIELVGYPGSRYSYWYDDPAEPIAPGKEKRIQVTNMIVGAAPDYVKVQAAVYADGSRAGAEVKVKQLLERRREVLETTRELIAMLGKNATAAELKEWGATLKPPAKSVVEEAAAELERRPASEVLQRLHASERALAAAKPQ